jgi:hypothetical protein
LVALLQAVGSLKRRTRRPTSVETKRVLPPARVRVTLPERPLAVMVVPSVGGSRYGPSRNTAGLMLNTAKFWPSSGRVLMIASGG